MTGKTGKIALAAVLALALAASAGCVRVELDEGYGRVKESTERVQLGGAEEIDARIEMGAGELTVGGGADGAMDADFEYTSNIGAPEVDYEVTGGVGDLAVITPDFPKFNLGSRMHYAWDVRLAEGVPMDLEVVMGAGEATLDLGGLDLTSLRVNLGAGETTIDLSGKPARDLDARLQAGAGSLTVIVPSDAGVRIKGVRDGIGDFKADGFKIEGDYLVNDLYGDAEFTYEIDVQRGVGDVIVKLAD